MAAKKKPLAASKLADYGAGAAVIKETGVVLPPPRATLEASAEHTGQTLLGRAARDPAGHRAHCGLGHGPGLVPCRIPPEFDGAATLDQFLDEHWGRAWHAEDPHAQTCT